MAASKDLPTKREEVTSGEVIPSVGQEDSPAHQSFKEALLGWSWVLKDSDESLPLTEEWWQHLTVSVRYFFHFYSVFHHIIFPISIFSQFFLTFSFSFLACLVWEGLQELELAMVGTPASWLVDLVSATHWWISSSSPSTASHNVEGQWALPHLALPWREPCMPPQLPHMEHHGRRWHYRRYPFPWAPLKPLFAPWKALNFWQHCKGDLLSPSTSLSLHFLLDPSSEST